MICSPSASSGRCEISITSSSWVLPQPGPPHTSVARPAGRPRPSPSSRPAIPVAAFFKRLSAEAMSGTPGDQRAPIVDQTVRCSRSIAILPSVPREAAVVQQPDPASVRRRGPLSRGAGCFSWFAGRWPEQSDPCTRQPRGDRNQARVLICCFPRALAGCQSGTILGRVSPPRIGNRPSAFLYFLSSHLLVRPRHLLVPACRAKSPSRAAAVKTGPLQGRRRLGLAG